MSALKLPYYRIWIMLSVVLTACESSDSVKNEAVADLEANGELLEEMRNEINIGLAQKSAWQKHWESQIGRFDAENFEFVTTDSIDAMEMPERNPILESDPLFPYQFPHPEGNGTMDIFSYKVEAQEGLDQPFLNPDSEVIWYRADGMKERLLFMGPSGMFEEGLWLNASEFLVLGYFQEDAGFRPMAWIIDLTSHRFSQFKMNQVVKDYAQESYLDQKLKSVDLGSDGV
ncbi:bifunctional isocitrate dehydrogenase kinase/phosphatase [Algoriphagus terrigena]|uniref:bifunctional isocitrate dehydrogenase kinase/phosphatase n=1 Tax=Algoriphagus terrigena TaxID=344884 RepID=UPI0012FA30F5|nr:bifunctional isocitrate dehydrogenase kinase/phosphatase [Algoriphagus terrigena]